MQKIQTHKMYGLITGLAMVILSLALYVSGLGFKPWAQYLTYVVMLIGLIMNAQAYAKANDHYVTYGNVWGSCFKACSLITIVVLAGSLLMFFVFPEMKEKGMEIARESMEKKGMAEEQIDQGLAMTEKFFMPFMIGGIIFMTMFYGAILSLIAAAIPKKKGDGLPPVAQ